MASQPSFFDEEPLPPYQRHSETSLRAAVAMLPKVGTARRRVYDYISSRKDFGATDNEGIEYTGYVQGYRARRGELADMGLVRLAGFRRRTRAGLEAEVWVAS